MSSVISFPHFPVWSSQAFPKLLHILEARRNLQAKPHHMLQAVWDLLNLIPRWLRLNMDMRIGTSHNPAWQALRVLSNRDVHAIIYLLQIRNALLTALASLSSFASVKVRKSVRVKGKDHHADSRLAHWPTAHLAQPEDDNTEAGGSPGFMQQQEIRRRLQRRHALQ